MNSLAQESSNIPVFRVPTIEEIREAREKRPIAIMLTVYADESGDEKQKRIFVVAGLIGTQNEWQHIENKWINRTGGVVFHATDCEANFGNFKHNSPQENQALYKDLTKILAASPLWGFGNALDIQSYKDTMPYAIDVSPYFQCFGMVVHHLALLGSVYMPKQRIEYVFHRRIETEYNAFYFYDYLRKASDMKIPEMSDKISSATSETIGIQIADLFAREVMKDFEWLLDRQDGHITRRRRISWETLVATNRLKFVYWFRKDFELLAKDMSRIDQEKGDQWAAYEKWRAQEGCIDNVENRIRFLFVEALSNSNEY